MSTSPASSTHVSVGAPSSAQRRPLSLAYLDVVVVVIAAVPALSLGAPVLGYVVGAVAWILQRAVSVVTDSRLANVADLRRRLGLGVASSMLRVWVLACTILAVGVASSRPDGLTAALVIFGAFSIYFAGSAFAHVTRDKEQATR
jgi:hypothetical protein